jgi:hypothetical protein
MFFQKVRLLQALPDFVKKIYKNALVFLPKLTNSVFFCSNKLNARITCLLFYFSVLKVRTMLFHSLGFPSGLRKLCKGIRTLKFIPPIVLQNENGRALKLHKP